MSKQPEGYQPEGEGLDTSKPPQGGSGVPPRWMIVAGSRDISLLDKNITFVITLPPIIVVVENE